MRSIRLAIGLVGLASVAGCSDAMGSEPRSSGSAGAASVGGTAGGIGGAPSTTGGAGGSAGSSGSGSILEAPDEAKALVAFLEAKQYATWAKELDYHASTGPHGDAVRVYYSPKAAAALSSGSTTFPAGAAAVKELTSGGSLYGYAVWVKVQDATDAGNGFYWYELIHQGGGNDSIYGDARGSSDCVGCHATGKDYDLSTLPFE